MKSNNKKKELKLPLLLISCLFGPFWSTYVSSANMNFVIPMRDSLNTSLLTSFWVFIIFGVVCAAMVMIVSQIADLYGHMKVFFYSLTGYFISCILFAIGDSIAIVMVATAIRGACSATIVPLSLVLIKKHFPKEKFIKYNVIWSFSMASGYAIGVLICGLCSYATWRLFFWITLPIMGITLIFLLPSLKLNEPKKGPKEIDYTGCVFLFSGVFILLLLLCAGPFWGWTSSSIITFYAVSPVLLIIFFVSQLYTKNPIVNYAAFTNLNIIVSLIMGFVNFGILNAMVFLHCYFTLISGGPNYSPFLAGATLLPLTVPVLFCNMISSKIRNKIGFKKLLLLSSAITFAGCLNIYWFNSNSGYINLWWMFLLIGSGIGIGFPIPAKIGMSVVEKKFSGMMSGALSSCYMIGAVICVAIAAICFLNSSQSFVTKNINKNHSQQIVKATLLSQDKYIKKIDQISNNNSKYKSYIKSTVKNGFYIGFQNVGLFCAIIAALGFIVSALFIKEKDLN